MKYEINILDKENQVMKNLQSLLMAYPSEYLETSIKAYKISVRYEKK